MFPVINGAHLVAVSPHLGEGRHQAFESRSVPKADVFLKAGVEPGEFFDFEGSILQVARSRSALVKGETVRRFFGGATRSGTVAAAPAPTKAVIKASFALVDGDVQTVQRSRPVLIFMSSGTSSGQLRQIRENTGPVADANLSNLIKVAKVEDALSYNPAATDVDSPDAFTTAPAAADGLDIIVPWEVELSTSVDDYLHGVSLGTSAVDEYTVLGIAGTFLTRCVGTTNALVARGIVVPSGVSGQVKGPNLAAAVIADAVIQAKENGRSIGWAYSAYSGAVGLRAIEWFGNFAR